MFRDAFNKIIQAIFDAQEAKRKESYAQRRAANWTAAATVAIAFFTLISLGVGIAQWSAINTQQHDANRFFQEQSRPFVSIYGLQIFARGTQQPSERTWECVLSWKNTGLSEARDAASYATWEVTTANGMRVAAPVATPVVPFFLAPGAVTNTRFSVPDDIINQVRAGTRKVNIRWYLTYGDRFDNTKPPHRTRQGWILDRIYADTSQIKDNGELVWFDTQPIPNFACVDDECR